MSRDTTAVDVTLCSNVIRPGKFLRMADTVEDSVIHHLRRHHYVFIPTSNGLFASAANCA